MSVKATTVLKQKKLLEAVKNAIDNCYSNGFTGRVVVSMEKGMITNTRKEENYNTDDLLTEFGEKPKQYIVKARKTSERSEGASEEVTKEVTEAL